MHVSDFLPGAILQLSRRSEAPGQTAPSQSEPSAQTETEHVQGKWSMFYIRTHSECTRSKSKGCIIKMCTDISSRSICPWVRRWNKDQATCLHDGVDVGRSQLVFVRQTMICRSITSQGCVQMLMEGGIFRLGKI